MFDTHRLETPLKYGRISYPRTARAMAAVSLKWASIFRRRGALDASRAWLDDARKWRTGAYPASSLMQACASQLEAV